MSDDVRRDAETGISIRFVQNYDVERDIHMTRVCSEHGKIESSPCPRCADVQAGRLEILREIAAIFPESGIERNPLICSFCDGDYLDEHGQHHPHKPDCLWLRAQQVLNPQP